MIEPLQLSKTIVFVLPAPGTIVSFRVDPSAVGIVKPPVIPEQGTLAGHVDNVASLFGMSAQQKAARLARDTAKKEGGSSRMMQVTVPIGVKPGQVLEATAPDGTKRRCTVPAGCAPGTVLQIPWA